MGSKVLVAASLEQIVIASDVNFVLNELVGPLNLIDKIAIIPAHLV